MVACWRKSAGNNCLDKIVLNSTEQVWIPGGSRDKVDALHAKALQLGATDDGAPGERVPGVFYGAYVRDPDGNKLCFYEMTM